MIGDGMGPQHVELARLLAPLAMDQLDSNPSLATTHNIFGEVTDSAAGGTALATGEKTCNRAISMDCDGNVLETVWELAEGEGKATGILTSVYLSDATPAVWAAHATSRSLRYDIALQQAYAGVEVLLGADRAHYLPQGGGGWRSDGRNLIEEMVEIGYSFVDNAEELEDVDPPEGKLVGLFGGMQNLTYVLERELNGAFDEPTLAEMTAKAIEVLSSDQDGFFMMVEGGAIDWLSHYRDVAGTAAEIAAFDQAVQVALDFATADGETLVVVTADHETGDLQLSQSVDPDFIRGITATADFMWQAIRTGEAIEGVLETYAGFTPTGSEVAEIVDLGEEAICNILNERAGVSLGWDDYGYHTLTPVPVFAFGPGAEDFDGPHLDNTDTGKLLLSAVSGRRH
jgi:alkaline phosphatase